VLLPSAANFHDWWSACKNAVAAIALTFATVLFETPRITPSGRWPAGVPVQPVCAGAVCHACVWFWLVNASGRTRAATFHFLNLLRVAIACCAGRTFGPQDILGVGRDRLVSLPVQSRASAAPDPRAPWADPPTGASQIHVFAGAIPLLKKRAQPHLIISNAKGALPCPPMKRPTPPLTLCRPKNPCHPARRHETPGNGQA